MSSFVTSLTLFVAHVFRRAIALNMASFTAIEAEFEVAWTLKAEVVMRSAHITHSCVFGGVRACRFVVAELVASVTLNHYVRVSGEITRDLLLRQFLFFIRV